MPIKTFQFTVGTAAALVTNPATSRSITIPSSATAPVPVEIDNSDGTLAVYWGGADVAASGATTGSKVAVGAKAQPILYPGDDLYLVSSGACTVVVAAGRQ